MCPTVNNKMLRRSNTDAQGRVRSFREKGLEEMPCPISEENPKFRMMMGNLQDVKHSLFLYNDALVEGLLMQVWSEAKKQGLSCACFTYLHEDKQYIVAQAGTLPLGDHCAACDSVCRHNTVVSEILAIGDLTKDDRTLASELVTKIPFLKSYQGVRLTRELSLIVLTSEPLNEDECIYNKKRIARTTAFLVPLLGEEKDEIDNRIRLVVDRSNIIVRATLGSQIFFDAPEGLVGKNLHVPQAAKKDKDEQRLSSVSPQHPMKALSFPVLPEEVDLATIWNAQQDDSMAFHQFIDLRLGTKTADLQLHRYDRVIAIDIVDKTAQNELEMSKYEIEIQRRVLSQIGHELRNKFTSAIDVMELCKDLHHRIADSLASSDKTTVSSSHLSAELKSTARDMTGAIQLLREGNDIINTRLTLHRMIAGTYDTMANNESITMCDLLEQFATDARRVHEITMSPADDSSTKLDVQIEGNAATVPIRVDLNVLNHVLTQSITNTLHAFSGQRVGDGPDEKEGARPKRIKLTALLLKTESLKELDEKQLGEIDAEGHSCWLEVRIRDTGNGVADHLVDKLFSTEPLNAQGRGCGLGLPSSALFLRTINGKIWLESTKNNDHSEFRFRMPCRVLSHTSWKASQSSMNLDESPLPVTSTLALAESTAGSSQRKYHTSTTPKAAKETPLPPASSNDKDSNIDHVEAASILSPKHLHIIEDSTMMRTMIIKKIHKALNELGIKDTVVEEYESNEAFLEATAHMPQGIPSANSIVTVDHNTGGSLCGSHTIQELRQNKYSGVIISISGEDSIAKEHISLGAHTALGKPLPPVSKLKQKLNDACATAAKYRLAYDVSERLGETINSTINTNEQAL